MTPEEMQDRDIVEFTDDSGNTLMLEVMDISIITGRNLPRFATRRRTRPTMNRTTTLCISCR